MIPGTLCFEPTRDQLDFLREERERAAANAIAEEIRDRIMIDVARYCTALPDRSDACIEDICEGVSRALEDAGR